MFFVKLRSLILNIMHNVIVNREAIFSVQQLLFSAHLHQSGPFIDSFGGDASMRM